MKKLPDDIKLLSGLDKRLSELIATSQRQLELIAEANERLRLLSGQENIGMNAEALRIQKNINGFLELRRMVHILREGNHETATS